MPIFEYRCQDCGTIFEAILLGSGEAECPKCHTQNLQQQLSTFAVSTKSSRPSAGCGAEKCCMGSGACSVN